MAREIGWREMLLIGGALKAGLFQALNGKELSAIELADNLAYSPRAVEIVLEALKSLGYVSRKHSHYRLTKKSNNLFIDKRSEEYSVGSVIHNLRLVKNWLNLNKAIITGKSQTRARKMEEMYFFIEAMQEDASKTAKEVVSRVLAANKEARSLLDLGGGPGTYAKYFADRGIEVTLLDIPSVVTLIKPSLGKHRNIRIIQGDFNRELPPGKFDVILMANITHIYNPEKNTALFGRARKSLSGIGLLAIVDLVRGLSREAELFAVNMLINTAGGGTWTVNQYRRWLGQAGLRLTSIQKLKKGDQAILLAKQGG